MQKKLNRKLTLSRETLRNLSLREIYEVKGGQTEDTVCSSPTLFSCPTELSCPEECISRRYCSVGC